MTQDKLPIPSKDVPEYHTECRYPDCLCKRVSDPTASFGFRLECEAPPLPPTFPPKDVLRDEPSAKHKKGCPCILAIQGGQHCTRNCDFCTCDSEAAASKLSPVPPSPAAIAVHEADILDRAMVIVRSYFHDAKPELREDGRWTMNVIPSTSRTHMMWSETERDLWIDFAISLSKPKPAPSEVIHEAEETMKEEVKYWCEECFKYIDTTAPTCPICTTPIIIKRVPLAPVEATPKSVEMIYEAKMWEKHSTEEKIFPADDLTRRVMDEYQFSAALNEFLNEISPKVEATGSETATDARAQALREAAAISEGMYLQEDNRWNRCVRQYRDEILAKLSPPSETKGTK